MGIESPDGVHNEFGQIEDLGVAQDMADAEENKGRKFAREIERQAVEAHQIVSPNSEVGENEATEEYVVPMDAEQLHQDLMRLYGEHPEQAQQIIQTLENIKGFQDEPINGSYINQGRMYFTLQSPRHNNEPVRCETAFQHYGVLDEDSLRVVNENFDFIKYDVPGLERPKWDASIYTLQIPDLLSKTSDWQFETETVEARAAREQQKAEEKRSLEAKEAAWKSESESTKKFWGTVAEVARSGEGSYAVPSDAGQMHRDLIAAKGNPRRVGEILGAAQRAKKIVESSRMGGSVKAYLNFDSIPSYTSEKLPIYKDQNCTILAERSFQTMFGNPFDSNTWTFVE